MAKEDFDLFWNTHLHSSDPSSQAVESIVLYWHSVKEEMSNYPWTRREGTARQHALAAVSRDIMTQVGGAKPENKIVEEANLMNKDCFSLIICLLRHVLAACLKRFIDRFSVRGAVCVFGVYQSVFCVSVCLSLSLSLSLSPLLPHFYQYPPPHQLPVTPSELSKPLTPPSRPPAPNVYGPHFMWPDMWPYLMPQPLSYPVQ